MKDVEIVVFADKSWVRFTEYQKVKEENEQLKQENKDLKSSLDTLESCVKSGEDFYIYTSDGKKYLLKEEVKECQEKD